MCFFSLVTVWVLSFRCWVRGWWSSRCDGGWYTALVVRLFCFECFWDGYGKAMRAQGQFGGNCHVWQSIAVVSERLGRFFRWELGEEGKRLSIRYAPFGGWWGVVLLFVLLSGVCRFLKLFLRKMLLVVWSIYLGHICRCLWKVGGGRIYVWRAMTEGGGVLMAMVRTGIGWVVSFSLRCGGRTDVLIRWVFCLLIGLGRTDGGIFGGGMGGSVWS